jgi:ubiquitin C-terminal hydrolase
MNVNN